MNVSRMIRGLAACLLLALVPGCGRPPAAPPDSPARFDPGLVDGLRALDEVKSLLALGLRDSGTAGAARAAEHLRQRLEAAGMSASIDEFRDLSPLGDTTFRNVIGVLPGRGEGLVILGSHYDTRSGMDPGFEGANDSGSSTGLLLELARVAAAGPAVGPELWFVFFDGEECMRHYGPKDGLHGSRRMAEQLVREGRHKEVKAMILLDMIGDRDLSVTIPRNSTAALIARAFEAARAEGARQMFGLFPGDIGDDHVPFLDAGIPVVNLIDFQYGSAPGKNDYWHTAEDTIDKISADSLAVVGRVTVRLVNTLL